MISNSTRAGRQTIDQSGGTGRELYPTDSFSGNVNEDFCLPSMVRAYAVTIPDGTFGAGAGAFVLGLFKVRTMYKFSQRRTDIEDLVSRKRDEVV
jgi:hypothetical protein